MLAVQEWAKDKNPFLALFATQLVANTRDVHLDFSQIREYRLSDRQFPLPSFLPWFAMYRSHRKLINFLKTIILKSSMYSKDTYEHGEALINYLTAISSGKAIKGVDLYKVQKLMRHKSPIMTQLYAHHYPESLRDGVEVLDRLGDEFSPILAQCNKKGLGENLQTLELIGCGGQI